MKVANFQVITYERIINPETGNYEWTHYITAGHKLLPLSVRFNERITNDMMIDATENNLWFHIEHRFFYFIRWDNTRKYIFVESERDNGICNWKFWMNSCERRYYLLKLIDVKELEEE